MSFLTPFYIAGALAVSLPLLFHLIRRTPRGRVQFSSLMFLQASPPRITRRSRIDNWLLLLLRAAILCLLAIAFARPFLRDNSILGEVETGRRIAILLDTSASMRRGDLWSLATGEVESLLEDLEAVDRVALFTFDDRLRSEVGFDDESEVAIDQKVSILRRRLAEIRPTWRATDLGQALTTVADMLEASQETGPDEPPPEGQPALEIALVTDLQRGSRTGALSALEWPERVKLSLHVVTPSRPSNAGLVVLESDGSAAGAAEDSLRVRISNESGSSSDAFSLRWAGAAGKALAEAAANLHVPPGESRVVTAFRPPAAAGAQCLVLEGDDHDFDNTFFVVRPVEETITVLLNVDEEADDAEGLRYYAERALQGESSRRVEFIEQAPEQPLIAAADRPPALILVTTGVPPERARNLLRLVSSGATLLFVLEDAADVGTLGALLDCEELEVEEVKSEDYAMLSEIDFSHPLFALFADPRFSDFTSIRFWRHRRVGWPADEPPEIDVLARFDRGDPAFLERRVGEGRVLVLTSGWHPRDSQLALSTKFVPLINQMLESPDAEARSRTSFLVAEAVPLPDSPPREEDVSASENVRRSVVFPDGSEALLAAADEQFRETEQPGVYHLRSGDIERQFAVNVSPLERRTEPLAVEDLERHGVLLGTGAEEIERRKQWLDSQLESSQKFWQWLVAAALGLIVLETWLAGRLARSIAKREVVA